MKILKRYLHLLFITIGLSLLISILLYFFKPSVLTHSPVINWIALIFVVLIIISRWGSRRLVTKDAIQPQPEKKPFSQWFLHIIALEIAIFMLYIGIFLFNLALFPTNNLDSFASLQENLSQALVNFGLFPWPLISLFAICFAIMAFQRQQDSYLDTIALGIYKKQFEPLNVTFKGIGRALTLTTLSFSAVMATLSIATLFSNIQYVNMLLGPTLPAIATAFILFFLSIRPTRSPLLLAVQTARPALGLVLALLIWAIFIALFSYLIHAQSLEKLTMNEWLTPIFSRGWLIHWRIFSVAWWFMIMPLTAITIARFSYGYSLRSIALAVLALPAAIAVLLISNAYWHHRFTFVELPHVGQICTLIGFFLLLILTMNKSTLPLISQTYLAKLGEIKHRNESIFILRWKRLCGLFFYLFIPGGIAVVSLLLMLLLLPTLFLIIVVLIHTFFLLKNK